MCRREMCRCFLVLSCGEFESILLASHMQCAPWHHIFFFCTMSSRMHRRFRPRRSIHPYSMSSVVLACAKCLCLCLVTQIVVNACVLVCGTLAHFSTGQQVRGSQRNNSGFHTKSNTLLMLCYFVKLLGYSIQNTQVT